MKSRANTKLVLSGIFLLLFCVLIAALKFVDVRAIGPEGSSVGLAAINEAVHGFFGVNLVWYKITDVLGFAAIGVAGGFALFGLWQLISRRSFKKVDTDIYFLAGCYAAAVLVYILFEHAVINFRPVILDGGLEASFPSSHTVLSLCIMSTAAHQFFSRAKNRAQAAVLCSLCAVFSAAIVIGRLVSGVHWFTDTIGGVLISAAIVFLYLGLCEKFRKG